MLFCIRYFCICQLETADEIPQCSWTYLIPLLQVVLGKPQLFCREEGMKQVLPCQLPDCLDGTDPCNPHANAVQSESTSVKSEELSVSEGLNHRAAVVWTTSTPTTVNLAETTFKAFDSTPSMSTFKNEAGTESLSSTGQNEVIDKHLAGKINEVTSTVESYKSKGKILSVCPVRQGFDYSFNLRSVKGKSSVSTKCRYLLVKK